MLHLGIKTDKRKNPRDYRKMQDRMTGQYLGLADPAGNTFEVGGAEFLSQFFG